MAGIIALQIIAYAALLAFAVLLTVKIVRYAVIPVHLRWELYPVARETGHPTPVEGLTLRISTGGQNPPIKALWVSSYLWAASFFASHTVILKKEAFGTVFIPFTMISKGHF